MAHPATQEVDKRQVIFNALSKDPKYNKFIPSTVEEFNTSLEDPESAARVFDALNKDQKYSRFLPDQQSFNDIFIPTTKAPPLKPGEVGPPQAGEVLPPPAPSPPVKEEPPAFDTIEGVQQQLQDDLLKDQQTAMDDILEDVQADFDAGNLTEQEANAMITRRSEEVQDELFEKVDDELDRRTQQFNIEQSRPDGAVAQDVVSRISERKVVTPEDIEAGREQVRQNEELRKTFNKIAADQLAALPESKPESSALLRSNPLALIIGKATGQKVTRRNPEETLNIFTRDILERLSTMSADETATFIDGLGGQGAKLIPFLGSLAEIPSLLKKRDVLNKPEDKRTESEQQLVNAIALMNSFDGSGLRPTEFEWGEMVGQMIPFLGEFAATGGVATAVSRGVGKQLIKGGLKKGIVNYTIRGVSGAVAQATANPQRYVSETIRRQTPIDQAIINLDTKEVDSLLRAKEGEGITEAATKAYLLNISEMVTERLGFAYGAGAKRFLTSKVGQQLINPNTIKKFTLSQIAKRKGLGSMSELKKFKDRVGLQSVVTEVWGEELPNMALNEVITGDSGRSVLESLNPVDENLLKMIVPMMILQGGIYAPTGAIGLKNTLVQKFGAKKPVEAEITKEAIDAKVVSKKKVEKKKPLTFGQKAARSLRAAKIKAKEDAIQKPSPGKVPVRDKPVVSQEVPKQDKDELKEPTPKVQVPTKKVEETKTEIENLEQRVRQTSGLIKQLNEEKVLPIFEKQLKEAQNELKKDPKSIQAKNKVNKISTLLESRAKVLKTQIATRDRLQKQIDVLRKKDPKPEVKKVVVTKQALTSQLSAVIAKENKLSPVLATAKAKGHFTAKGQPKQTAPDNIVKLFEQSQDNKAEIKKLRSDIAGLKKPSEKAVAQVSQSEEIETKKTEIRQLEAVVNAAANKADVRNLAERVTLLKKETRGLTVELGETKDIIGSITSIDKNARITRDAVPKTSRSVSETTYTFNALGIEGKIQKVSIPGQPDIFYATTLDGKKASFGSDTPAAAVNELRKEVPRKVIEQVGEAVVSVKGDTPSKSITDVAANLNSSPKVVRTEIGELEGKHRKVRIFIEGGKIATVHITPRGKVVIINKKTGKESSDLTTSKTLSDNTDIIELLNNPKPATTVRFDTDVDVDATIVNPDLFTEKGRDWARQIRSKKISTPKGVLRASSGFEEVYNGALEIAATVMESGGKFVDALRAAMKHIRLSKWFKELPPDQQILRENQAEEEIRNAYLSSGIPVDGKKIDAAVEAERVRLQKENKSILKDKMQRIIFKRRADISLGAYKTRLFVEGINIQTTVLEREMLPFIIEKTGIPKALKRPDLEEAFETRDVAKLNKIAAEIRVHNNEVWKQMTRGKEEMDKDLIEDYITHIWEIEKNKRTDVVTYFTTDNKWSNARYINTLFEGIERFQLTPKLLDISKILTVHGSMANNVEANREFVDQLKTATIGGKRLMLHNTAKSVPGNWVTISHPSLRAFKVQPEVANALIPVFQRERGKNQKIVQGIEKLNSVIKGMQLTISLFHHGALVEAALPLLGFRAIDAVFRQSIGRGILAAKANITGNKTWAQLPYAFQKSALAEDALRHGVQLGASIDIRIKQLESIFDKATKGLEKGGKVVGGKVGGTLASILPSILQKGVEANNVLLWDYLHDTLKLMAYQRMVRKIPKKFDTPELIRKYKIEQGQFVNDSFGGQNFDVLGISPLMVQSAKWMLLSPDWTLSTLRQAAPVVLGLPYLGAKAIGANQAAARIGKAMGAQFESTAGVRAKTGLNFWWKAALIYGFAYNLYNAWSREEDIEENPHLYTKEEKADPLRGMMWKNTIGHHTHVFDGRYEDGSERHLRIGKQFRELPELFLDDTPDLSVSIGKPFVKKIGGKLSPLMQVFLKTFTGKSGSGFEDFQLKDKNSWEWTGAWIKTTALAVFPFSFSAAIRDDKEFKAADLIFPSSKGMSMSKGIRLLQHYMAKGDAKTQALVMRQAMRNNLNIKDMGSAALSGFKAMMSAEIAKDLKTVQDARTALQRGGLSDKEYKVLERKLFLLEQDIDEKLAGEEMILKNLEDWIKFREETGDIQQRDLDALQEAQDSFLLNVKKK